MTIDREKLSWKLAEAWYMTNPDTGFDNEPIWFYSLPHARRSDLFLKACQALSVIEPVLAGAEGMAKAIRPFAAIRSSALYPEDGSEKETYRIFLDKEKPDFTGEDLAKIRQALAAFDVAAGA